MRFFEFAKRNFKEIYRDPVSWVFMLILPVAMFVVFEILIAGIGGTENVPQFEIKHLTVSMIIFSFSFLTIFSGNNLAKDREDRFLLRLKSTPMKGYDFVLGYTLSIIPFIIIQEIVVTIVGLIYGLSFNGSTFLLMVCMFPVAFIFIGFGILFGSIVSTKGVGSVAGIVPTASCLLGGMFFPLNNLKGGFKVLCEALPFANAVSVGQAIIGDEVNNLNLSILLVIVYVAVIYIVSIIIFTVKMRRDSI